MKNLIIIIALLSISFSAFGQFSTQPYTPKNNSQLQILVGYNEGSFRDLNFSPLGHNLSGGSIALSYAKHNVERGTYFKTQFNFAPSIMRSNNGQTFQYNHLAGGLSVSYLKKIYEPVSNLNIYAGGSYRSSANFVMYNGLDAFTFLFAHSLEASARVEYTPLKNHRISSNLSLPLATVAVRPPHAGFDKDIIDKQDEPLRLIFDGELGSFNRYGAFRIENRYTYQWKEKTGPTKS